MSFTALMGEAKKGNLEGVRTNLGDVGRGDKDGWTALMWASSNGHAKCIPLLEKEIGMKSEGGWTALMFAAKEDYSECILFLEKEIGMQTTDGWTALMWAAYNGRTDCVELLLSEAGKQTANEWGDLVTTYPPGTTALMIATFYNYSEIVELLLPYEQGLKDAEGRTAKWYANNGSTKRGDFTQVRKILENEGTERVPPPNNEMLRLRRRINELTAENESFRQDLSSSKNAYEESERKLSHMNKELSFLKQQLDEATEESGKHAGMHYNLQKASEQNQALIEEITAKNNSLQEQLASSNTAREEAEETLSQMNREVTSLQQQLQKANEEAKKHESLQKTSEQNQALIKELTTENDSLKDQYALLENAREEAEERLAQSNREVSSLKEQLDKVTEESKRYGELQKASGQNQDIIDELTILNTSLQEQLVLSRNIQEETDRTLFQMNQEIDLLRQQLQKATSEVEKNQEMYTASNQKAQEAEKSLAEARNEVSSFKDQISMITGETASLRRQLEDEKEKNAGFVSALLDLERAKAEIEGLREGRCIKDQAQGTSSASEQISLQIDNEESQMLLEMNYSNGQQPQDLSRNATTVYNVSMGLTKELNDLCDNLQRLEHIDLAECPGNVPVQTDIEMQASCQQADNGISLFSTSEAFVALSKTFKGVISSFRSLQGSIKKCGKILKKKKVAQVPSVFRAIRQNTDGIAISLNELQIATRNLNNMIARVSTR